MGLGTHGFWGCAGGITIGDDTIFGKMNIRIFAQK